MILQIAVTVLILGFAFFQMKQGFFNALIMGVCSFFSVIIAISTYRWVADATNLYGALPLLAEPGCIGLVFFVSLIVLRYLAEKFIPGNIIFNIIIERTGAAICGLFSGTIFVGILLIVTLMLPLGENVLGYHQYNDDLTRDKNLAPFCPDDFIVSLGQLASAGSKDPLMQGNNDILLDAFCVRNTAGKNGLSEAKNVFKITNVSLWKKPTVKVPQYPLGPKADKTKVWVIRTEISNSEANPEDHWWRLPATQFKLITKKQNGTIYTYYPVGYLYVSQSNGNWTLQQGPNGGKDIAKLIVERPDPTKVRKKRRRRREPEKDVEIMLNVDWVFMIPGDVTPEAIVFRHSVITEVPKANSRLSLKLKGDALKQKPPGK